MFLYLSPHFSTYLLGREEVSTCYPQVYSLCVLRTDLCSCNGLFYEGACGLWRHGLTCVNPCLHMGKLQERVGQFRTLE